LSSKRLEDNWYSDLCPAQNSDSLRRRSLAGRIINNWHSDLFSSGLTPKPAVKFFIYMYVLIYICI